MSQSIRLSSSPVKKLCDSLFQGKLLAKTNPKRESVIRLDVPAFYNRLLARAGGVRYNHRQHRYLRRIIETDGRLK
jgi:transposase-like protein